jgi:membrane associated rhomboid family serine protease
MDISQTPVAILIFISTIAISLYTLYKDHNLLNNLILHPYSLVRYNRYYTLITSGFVHGSVMHLMFNMFSFLFFAFQLESIVGSFRFTIIYFGSLILADLTTVFKQKDNQNYSALGASGAISAVVFSTIMYIPTAKMSVMLLPIGIPAFIFGPLYLSYCYYAAKHQQDNVNHDAHLWGALAGVILTIILDPSVIQHFLSFF